MLEFVITSIENTKGLDGYSNVGAREQTTGIDVNITVKT